VRPTWRARGREGSPQLLCRSDPASDACHVTQQLIGESELVERYGPYGHALASSLEADPVVYLDGGVHGVGACASSGGDRTGRVTRMTISSCVPGDASEELGLLLRRLFAAHDADGAVAAAVDAVSAGRLSVENLHCAVLVPMLSDVGGRWHAGELHVWEEHLESAAVRAIIEGVRPFVRAAHASAIAAHPGERPLKALFACPPGGVARAESAHACRPVQHGGLGRILSRGERARAGDRERCPRARGGPGGPDRSEPITSACSCAN
jgi:hypothetical protein